MAKRPSASHSRKGLATIALLKVHYDAGEDHIGMFIPFVADAVRQLGEGPSSLEEIRDEIESLHGLSIPRNSLQTLPLAGEKEEICARRGRSFFARPERVNGLETSADCI